MKITTITYRLRTDADDEHIEVTATVDTDEDPEKALADLTAWTRARFGVVSNAARTRIYDYDNKIAVLQQQRQQAEDELNAVRARATKWAEWLAKLGLKTDDTPPEQ